MTIDLTGKTWLRVADLAQHYEVSAETVRRWVRDGRLKAVTIGREFRFYPDDVRSFEESLRDEARA